MSFSSRLKWTTLILILILVVLNPSVDKLRESESTLKHLPSVLSQRLYETHNFHLFSIIKMGMHFQTAYIGILNQWIPVSKNFWLIESLIHWKSLFLVSWTKLQSFCSFCKNGICIGQERCFCFLPSYSTKNCAAPIKGFVPLWTWMEPWFGALYPSTHSLFYQMTPSSSSCFLGIPLNYFPLGIESSIKRFGLVNLSERLGVLDLVLYTLCFMYLVHFLFPGIHARLSQRKGVASALSLFYHSHLLHLLLNVIGLYLYAPSLVESIGSLAFLQLHVLFLVGAVCLYLFFNVFSFGYSGMMTCIRFLYLQRLLDLPLDTLALQIFSQMLFDMVLNQTEWALHALGLCLGMAYIFMQV